VLAVLTGADLAGDKIGYFHIGESNRGYLGAGAINFDRIFDALIEIAPEVVVFGSGARLRFPHPRLLAKLSQQRIGVETMDFGAACRTYNILMSEGRRVAAALLIEA